MRKIRFRKKITSKSRLIVVRKNDNRILKMSRVRRHRFLFQYPGVRIHYVRSGIGLKLYPRRNFDFFRNIGLTKALKRIKTIKTKIMMMCPWEKGIEYPDASIGRKLFQITNEPGILSISVHCKIGKLVESGTTKISPR